VKRKQIFRKKDYFSACGEKFTTAPLKVTKTERVLEKL
jgi:hypothetical protein